MKDFINPEFFFNYIIVSDNNYIVIHVQSVETGDKKLLSLLWVTFNRDVV